MDTISQIILKHARVKPNEQLRGLLIKSMEKEKEIKSPKDYYFITDLCNPVSKYLKVKYPEIKEEFNPEKEKILVRGNKLHRFAEIWIQNMDNFICSESKLDGFLLGINATGRVDAKVNDQLLEFKSKKEIPKTIEEVITKYPQDIEQVAFYSVIDPLTPKENYLIFISQDCTQEMSVFKIITKSPEEILKVLKQRTNQIEGAKKDHVPPETLGKCRYCFKDNCTYYKKGMCKWEDKESLCDVLDFVEIQEDVKYKRKLEKAKSMWNGQSEIFRVNEIVSSRKTLHNNAQEKIDEEWNEPIEKTLSKDFASNIGFLLSKDYGEKVETYPQKRIQEIKENKKWINLKSCKNQKAEKVIPFVTGASLTESEWYLKNKIPEYKIVELGIICSIYGKSSGMIFEYLPNNYRKFRAYEVSFAFPEKITKEINKILQILKSNKISLLKDLPKCPDFFCKDCSIRDECED